MEGNLLLFDNDIHLAAHRFVPERLTFARDWRGVSKAELADRIGRTPSAVSQYESKRIKPDPQTIGRIGLALGVPVGFFARKMSTPLLPSESCHYRRIRAASQKDRRQLQARGSLLLELVLALSDHVDWAHESISSLAFSPRSDEDIETFAVRVRNAFGLGLGPLSHVVRLLENNGVIVTNIPGVNEDVDAFSAWHDHFPMIFLVDEKGSTSRTRFDAAHELGHLLMHVDVTPGDRDLERQADRFASAFLLPRETFAPECPTTFRLEHFLELKRRWKVSVAALIRRAYDLGKLSEANYRRAYVFLNKQGLRQREPCEPEPESPQLLGRAITLAQEDVTLGGIARDLGIHLSDLSDLLRYSSPQISVGDGL